MFILRITLKFWRRFQCRVVDLKKQNIGSDRDGSKL